MSQPNPQWQVCDRFLEMRSHWFTLIGEHLQDDQDQRLEYWRVERAHSVIILPIQAEQIFLLAPSYRPGLGAATLDFPGGRLPEGADLEQTAYHILQRELGIAHDAIAQLMPINLHGWAINSSFSNQLLYAFVAQIAPHISIPSSKISYQARTDHNGIQTLLTQLRCLQCRAILLEWWFNQRAQQDSNL